MANADPIVIAAAARSLDRLATTFFELMLPHHQIEKRRQNPMLIEAHAGASSCMTIATNAPEANVRTPMEVMAQAAPNKSAMMPAASAPIA